MPLNYRNPLTAVLLRRLAWEQYVARREFTMEDIETKHLPAARRELGLPPVEAKDRAAEQYLRGLFQSPKRLRLDGQNVKLVGKQWENEWRLHCLPWHDSVRQLSADLLCTELAPAEKRAYREWSVLSSDSAVPRLRVIVGPAFAPADACKGERGVYVVRRTRSLYIGQSSNLATRILGHRSEGEPLWTIAMITDEDVRPSRDELEAAEAVLISFWHEVAILDNKSLGKLQPPEPEHRQQGILFAKGSAAALHWLMRQKPDVALPDWSIPFRYWKEGWSESYLKLGDGK